MSTSIAPLAPAVKQQRRASRWERPPSPTASVKRGPHRELVVDKVEITQLSRVDDVQQCFDAQFVVQARFIGGANDPDLSRAGHEWPIDSKGHPTFRPSAEWFVHKTDFNNALEYESMSNLIRTTGDDIEILLYFKGTFQECLDLDDFPFDTQLLQISLCINCRRGGPLPIRWNVTNSSEAVAKTNRFYLSHVWRLHIART